ncbi:MAG TPA: hypothetical protein VFP92_05905 [Rhodanobacteraceae bacterium]|nr:hypothetical protein [Rhodanobacteraceae bacterium]
MQNIWTGRAVLLLTEKNPERSKGLIGAFCGFACAADNVAEAVTLLYRELEESGYLVVGLEDALMVQMLDRPLTDYEKELVEATKKYPVQIKNVHLHKGDA